MVNVSQGEALRCAVLSSVECLALSAAEAELQGEASCWLQSWLHAVHSWLHSA